MLVAPEDVARHLDQLFRTKFGGFNTGRYTISKTDLRRLAGRESLQTSIVALIIKAAFANHSLLLIPVDGTIDTANNFGVMKSSLKWRTVPAKQIDALA